MALRLAHTARFSVLELDAVPHEEAVGAAEHQAAYFGDDVPLSDDTLQVCACKPMYTIIKLEKPRVGPKLAS
jgi:hypothetical protein